MFGFGAKTAATAQVAASMFPVSRRIRNPFVPNDPDAISETLNECSQVLQPSSPRYLSSILRFMKALGTQNKQALARRSKTVPGIKISQDSFFVLYVLSSG